jgi:hypothetical protein
MTAVVQWWACAVRWTREGYAAFFFFALLCVRAGVCPISEVHKTMTHVWVRRRCGAALHDSPPTAFFFIYCGVGVSGPVTFPFLLEKEREGGELTSAKGQKSVSKHTHTHTQRMSMYTNAKKGGEK